ncbi:MAG: tRNA (adenosine(37)-N6)-dimethylallyltransferase MiaA [Acidobacteria bacterium]|nr:tRNA (adenosine(37)-N6)-dimethylallyltransferase MiaA [Acidobacteriota bacterium]
MSGGRTGGPPTVVAILGQTATGKSALGMFVARRFGGEIVNCDSTAVYRGLDIGTDKASPASRRDVAHHLIDVADPSEEYSAARYSREASEAIQDIQRRGRLPILVGGTGLYYRAMTRGLFPGPGRDAALRQRLADMAGRRGPEFLHRMIARVDAAAAIRIQPRDLKRLVRALEVYFLTGTPMSDHFARTISPLADQRMVAFGLRLPADVLVPRLERRVNEQFAAGVVDEVRRLLAGGLPRSARALGGLVYRQVLDLLDGVRDEAATRALIVRENRRYARRQLIWFRKEPNLVWIDGAGEEPATERAVESMLRERLTEDAAAHSASSS